jgi:transcriptional regulator GlxA family with amidase domain
MEAKSKSDGNGAPAKGASAGRAVPNYAKDQSSADYRPGFMELLPHGSGSVHMARPHFRVAFTLLPRFTLVAFAGFVDALRLSSDIGDRSQSKHCSWTLVGADRQPVPSSSGAAITHTELFSDPSRFDYFVVVGGLLDDRDDYDPRLLNHIRRTAAAGVTIVGLCTGVFALARAGVLDGYECCVHGYHLPDFTERFPTLRPISTQIFVVDRDRITCAGGAAAIDLAAYIIEQRCGMERARKILPHMLLDELRPPVHSQLSFVDDFFKVRDERVRMAVFLMQQNFSNPASIDSIARRIGVPARQLERGFQKSFSVSPSTFYRTMRLERAKWLLTHSRLSITQIAIDCGFADTSHLTRSFKRHYLVLPTNFRRRTTLQDITEPAERRWSPARRRRSI